MPPAPTAPAAAPASSCRRVRRTSGRRRPDEDEAAQDPVERLPHLAVGERWRDVLAHGVQRTVVPPGVEHVPLVGVLVDVEDRRDDATRTHRSAAVAEAGDQPALLRIGVDTSRYRSTSRIAAQVHVLLSAGRSWPGLLPDPAHQVAAVTADLVDVVPAA